MSDFSRLYGVDELTVSNPARVTYIKGSEHVDGSLRFRTVLRNGGEVTEIQERTSGLWAGTSFRAGANSVAIGNLLTLSAAGRSVVTRDVLGRTLFWGGSPSENGVTTALSKVINSSARVIRSILRSDESTEMVGTSLEILDINDTAHLITEKIYLKVGSVGATAPVRLQAWNGPDDTGILIFDQTYPASDFAANTEAAIDLNGFLEFEIGANTFQRYSSDEPFSLKADAGNTQWWMAIDFLVVANDDLLQTNEWVSGNNFTAGDWTTQDRKVYTCNVTGVQTGVFTDHPDKWDLLTTATAPQTSPNGLAGLTITDEPRLTYNDGVTDRLFVTPLETRLNSPDGTVNLSVIDGGVFVGVNEVATLDKLNFLALTDSPADFVAQAGRVVEVNLAEDGVQYGQNLTVLGNPTFNDLLIMGNTTMIGTLVVGGDFTVNGLTTTINSTTLEVLDKNIEMGVVAVPTDLTADGGGITLRGDTDKTILWTNLTDSWDFNQKVIAQAGLEVKGGDLLNFGLNMDPDSFAAGTGALGATTTGSINTMVGTDAGKAITGGFMNTAVGSAALLALTDGFFNTAVGLRALSIITTQFDNTAVGVAALKFTIGDGNTALGARAMGGGLGAGSDNVAIGTDAFNDVTSGSRNIAIGAQSLALANVAKSNIAIGWSALGGAVSGDFNIAIGEEALKNSTADDNVAIGFQALTANTTGIFNTAIGTDTLRLATTKSRNTAVGHKALEISTGSFNTAVGASAGINSTGGSSNSFFGFGAGKGVTVGGFNVVIGADAMGLGVGATQGNNNVAVGVESLSFLTLGNDNVAVGRSALVQATIANANVAVGRSALSSNVLGNDNTAIGDSAMSSTIADNNVAVGKKAMGVGIGTAAAIDNVAVGVEALKQNTAGSENITIGRSAMALATASKANIAIGVRALSSVLDQGDFNVAIGHEALLNATGMDNTAIGFHALKAVTVGIDNVAIGDEAGYLLTTGSNNIILGAGANLDDPTSSNWTMIGTPLTTDARIYGTNFSVRDGTQDRIITDSIGSTLISPDGTVNLNVDNTGAFIGALQIATVADLSISSVRTTTGTIASNGEFIVIGALVADITLTVTAGVTRFKVRDRNSNIGTFTVTLILEAGVTELILAETRDYVEVDFSSGAWYFYNFRNGVGTII